MKATIVLIANTDAENYGRKLMLDAHRIGNMGFEMARLPQHVSLKQPFTVPSLEEIEDFFDGFARKMKSVKIQFEELTVAPNNVIGGIQSGCMSIRAKTTLEIEEMQKQLFQELEERFGPCPAAFDNDYIFHMTIAIGGGSFENYQNAYDILSKQNYNKSFMFNKLGLLYYDDDNILPGTYFCYKIIDLL